MKKLRSTWNVTDIVFIIKSGFPYVSAQIFNEQEINMRITIMTCQIKRVTRGSGERVPMPFLEHWKKESEFWENIPWLWPSMV